ncbi:hypothetical protein [Corynebacterium sp. HMSC29G08]|uniref:hypothetical protein n=1 Tax=Corynebacterium sp. HMSC29G08 TaxID=1581069 RepID=UPI0008A3F644|nr:hypothetical protein [Corynebacterium sp. HMSC29G08]OFT84033.1 hypothetical protein HMPREF3101_05125 [Corynebacterium sp. HMSC29G08]
MGSIDSNADALTQQIEAFNEELSDAVEAFTGSSFVFEYSLLHQGDGDIASIRLSQSEGKQGIIPLFSQGKKVLGVVPEYRCSWDSGGNYLAVESSKFAVYPYGKTETEPLFRIEYVKDQNPNQPSSHIHVHAHRDEFTHLLGFAAKLNPERSNQVKRYFEGTSRVSQFHFPTGGHRFRPCLEEVFEVLRVAFVLDVDNGRWQEQLRTARLRWRKIQTAAVVRDDPREALRVLVEDFKMPWPEGWECPEPNLDKITRS